MYGGGGEGRGGEEWAVSHPGNGESRRDLGKHHHHCKGAHETTKSRRTKHVRVKLVALRQPLI